MSRYPDFPSSTAFNTSAMTSNETTSHSLDPQVTTTFTHSPATEITNHNASTSTSTSTSISTAPQVPSDLSTIKIGTRKSKLALHQTDMVLSRLKFSHPHLEYSIHSMSTIGDKDKITALHQFNAKSLWTHELEAMLLTGELDLIVHSLKDMPTQLPQGCCLGAVLGRVEKRDCFVLSKRCRESGIKDLGDLPEGSVVGTSSVRREAQIKRRWPGIRTKDVRGNVDTRLRKLDDESEGYACLILAAAALQRLELGDRISGFLSSGPERGGMLGAVGQGALGVEIREGDERVEKMVEGLREGKQWLECLAERSLLRTLEGGCSVPIGVESEWVAEEDDSTTGTKGEEKDVLVMKAIVVSVDGERAVEGTRKWKIKTAEEADECGWRMAKQLVDDGAGKILEEITLNRKVIEKQDGA